MNNINLNYISARIKETRVNRNISQQKVADGIGIALRLYQKYEHGETNPGILVFYKIAEYFDVSLDYLVGRIDDANSHKSR